MLAKNLTPLHRAAALAAIVVGCSSSTDSGNNDNGGGPAGQGGTNGFGGFGAFAGNSNPPPATCGNGQVDQGEECDGSTTATCESATLGARPVGTVSCSSCRVDTSLCSTNNPGGGATGTGGGIGTGGGVGTGGGLNMGGTSSGSGGSNAGGGGEPTIPAPSGTCQSFVTGDMTFKGQQVKIWAGAPAHGPLVIYWYATGSSVNEVSLGLGQAAINEITSQGGVVAAMYRTTAAGTTTGNNVWYTGDFDITDEVVACAVQQQHIDTHQIHAIGFSAGGLQSGYMAFTRSNYMASVVTYSGGSLTNTLQDPSNMPAVMCQHGDPGSDVVVIDFAKASDGLEQAVRSHGVFAMDCNHGGGHMIPTADVASSWQFMKDHPYKVNPEPYAGGLPAGFPSYCKIVP